MNKYFNSSSKNWVTSGLMWITKNCNFLQIETSHIDFCLQFRLWLTKEVKCLKKDLPLTALGNFETSSPNHVISKLKIPKNHHFLQRNFHQKIFQWILGHWKVIYQKEKPWNENFNIFQHFFDNFTLFWKTKKDIVGDVTMTRKLT